jgi:spermidine synthase
LIPQLGLRGSLDAMLGLAVLALALAAAGTMTRREASSALATAAVVAMVSSRLAAWDVRLMHLSISKQPDLALDLWRRGRIEAGLNDVHVLELRDGVDATVSVVESSRGARVLYLNGKADAGDREDMATQTVLGHLPLLVHPAPRRVLVIGMGSGVTVASVARHPVESIDLLELSPEVLDLGGRWFEAVNRDVVHDPRVHVRVEDGRNFVAFHPGEPYDVIVSQPSNPWMTGVANLFTDEFFAQARRRLRPDGVLAQWFHSYSMDTADVRALFGTLHRHFPAVYVFAFNPARLRGDMVVLAANAPVDFTGALTVLAGDGAIGTELRDLGIGPTELLQAFVISAENVDGFVGAAELNSDDHPVIELHAPRAVFHDTVAANLEAMHGASRGARLPVAGGDAFAETFAVRPPAGFRRIGSAYRNELAPPASSGARPLRELVTEVAFQDEVGTRLLVLGRRGRADREGLDRLARDAARLDVAEDGETSVAGHRATTYAAGSDGTRVAAWSCGPSGASYAAVLARTAGDRSPAHTLEAIGCH